MPSLGEARVSPSGYAGGQLPLMPSRRAADLLHEARGRERAGCIPEAIDRYEAAIASAEQHREDAVLSEALRRLAVIRYQRDESPRARELCGPSYDAVLRIGDDPPAAEPVDP